MDKETCSQFSLSINFLVCHLLASSQTWKLGDRRVNYTQADELGMERLWRSITTWQKHTS